jgi:aryl-alcohol dehydrogenase-like predicted oxidoreductase
MVEEFQKLGEELGHTPSQIVLAWLLAQGEDIFVIPGTTNADR